MLFDLRGRGRRNTIKVIYVTLAILLGGGLVLFGIGGATSGGLVDALTGTSQTGDSGTERYEKQETNALNRIKADPKDRKAYEDLISARVQLAGLDGRYEAETDSYTKEGEGYLRKAVETWNQYQDLKLPADDAKGVVANRIASAFLYLRQPQQFIVAQEIVAEARDATGPYQTLAQVAYQLGQIRKGDLAAEKAIELAPEELKATVESDMKQYKESAAQAAPSAAPSASADPSGSAAPLETPAPKKDDGGEKGK